MRVISNPKLIRRIVKGTSIRNAHLSVVVRLKRSNHDGSRRKKTETQNLNDEYDGDDEMTDGEKCSESHEREDSLVNAKLSRFVCIESSIIQSNNEENSHKTSNDVQHIEKTTTLHYHNNQNCSQISFLDTP